MSDFIVSKSFIPSEEPAETVAPREAIKALKEMNRLLERARPRHETVPDFLSVPLAQSTSG